MVAVLTLFSDRNIMLEQLVLQAAKATNSTLGVLLASLKKQMVSFSFLLLLI